MLPSFGISKIDLGFFSIHVWGVFAALAFLAGIYFAAHEAKKRNLNPEVVYDVAPWVILSAIVGSRVVFLVENPSSVKSFIDLVSVWKGGLAFHGGFFGAVIALLVYFRVKKLNFLKYADAMAVAVPLAHAIGRVGCFVTDMHIGKEALLPWSIIQDGSPRHPVAIYEFVALVAIFGIMLWLRGRKIVRFDGFLLASYVALYSFARFFVEFFRTDPVYYGLTAAQYIVLVLFIAAIGFILRQRFLAEARSV